jgi:hypothetical protein
MHTAVHHQGMTDATAYMGIQLADSPVDLPGGLDRPHGIILTGGGGTENRHDLIPHKALQAAAVFADDPGTGRKHFIENGSNFFGVNRFGQLCISAQIAEQDCGDSVFQRWADALNGGRLGRVQVGTTPATKSKTFRIFKPAPRALHAANSRLIANRANASGRIPLLPLGFLRIPYRSV